MLEKNCIQLFAVHYEYSCYIMMVASDNIVFGRFIFWRL